MLRFLRPARKLLPILAHQLCHPAVLAPGCESGEGVRATAPNNPADVEIQLVDPRLVRQVSAKSSRKVTLIVTFERVKRSQTGSELFAVTYRYDLIS